MDPTRLRRLRAMFARLKAEGALVHGGQGREGTELLSPNSKLYSERVRLPAYTTAQNVLSAQPRDAVQILTKRLPTWTPAQHKQASTIFAERAAKAQAAYNRMLNLAHTERFGRPYSPLDTEAGPLISGIVSDKYAPRWKTRLRLAAHREGDYRQLSVVHAEAAKLVTRSRAAVKSHAATGPRPYYDRVLRRVVRPASQEPR